MQTIHSTLNLNLMLRLFEWHKATAILITFDEDDFQKLVLNENGDIHAAHLSRLSNPLCQQHGTNRTTSNDDSYAKKVSTETTF